MKLILFRNLNFFKNGLLRYFYNVFPFKNNFVTRSGKCAPAVFFMCYLMMPRQEMKGAPKFVVAYDDVGGRAAWALQTKTVNLIGRQFGAPACALSSR